MRPSGLAVCGSCRELRASRPAARSLPVVWPLVPTGDELVDELARPADAGAVEAGACDVAALLLSAVVADWLSMLEYAPFSSTRPTFAPPRDPMRSESEPLDGDAS